MVKERRAQSAPHHPTAGLQGCWRHGHGYELVGVGAMARLSGHSYRCTADIARGAIRYWRIPVVARNWDIGVRALGCLCIMRLNRLTTEWRRSRPEAATVAGCGTSPIQHGMWHHTTAAHSTMQACRGRRSARRGRDRLPLAVLAPKAAAATTAAVSAVAAGVARGRGAWLAVLVRLAAQLACRLSPIGASDLDGLGAAPLRR